MKAKIVLRQLLLGSLDPSEIKRYLVIESLDNLAISVSDRDIVEISERFNMESTESDHRIIIGEIDIPEHIAEDCAELVKLKPKVQGYYGDIKDLFSSRPRFKMSTDEASALRAAKDDDGGPVSVGGFAVRHGLLEDKTNCPACCECKHPNAYWGNGPFTDLGKCVDCHSFLMRDNKGVVTIIADFTPDLGG